MVTFSMVVTSATAADEKIQAAATAPIRKLEDMGPSPVLILDPYTDPIMSQGDG